MSDLNIYTINPSQPFLKTLAEGLLNKYKNTDFLSDIRILLPTRRAGRILQELFLELSDKPLILPQISSLGDIDIDELSLTTLTDIHTDIPQAIAPLRRQLLLSELVGKVGALSLNESHSFALAGSLATLIDQIHTEDSDFEILDKIVPEDLSEQWQMSLQFLSIIKNEWPRKLAELGLIDPADRRKRLMKALISHWQKHPIESPVIAAGSTGSIPVTAELLKTIAALPQGEVILPGVDLELDSESWSAIEEGHPQATLKNLLKLMDVPRVRVRTWSQSKTETLEAREQLWREVMRPAETISQWQENLPTLKEAAFENIILLNCDTQEQEAQSIALILRETLTEKGKTAALVTPDRQLAERVKTYLHRWEIKIDDSAGEPLSQTLTGRFIRAVLQACKEDFSPVSLLTLLKHPYSRFGLADNQVLSFARKLDGKQLRGPWTVGSFEKLLIKLQEKDETKDLYTFLCAVQKTLTPLTEKLKDGSSLHEITHTHIKTCEEIATEKAGHGQNILWSGDNGEAASLFFQELLSCLSEPARSASFFSDSGEQTYPTIFDSFMHSVSVRPKYGTHPRLSILGQLEARLIHTDRVILSGLNEDVWPALPKQDPWMSRGMRSQMGLPSPERSITLSAHDFVQGACAKEVFLTRSEKVDNVPAVPARWLQRLGAICQSLNQCDLDKRAQKYLLWSRKMNHALETDKTTLEAPYPVPPVERRPKEFSVSSLELLMRDPYSLYAKKVLRLRPLDPLEEVQGAKEKGTYFHDILKNFCVKWPDTLPDSPEDELLRIGRDTFGDSLKDPSLWVSWWPRFENMASWFIAHEKEWRGKGYHFEKGEIEGKTHLHSYILTARADRIDRHKNGGLAVIDYKTSTSTYSAIDVAAGFYPQLTVEALILQDKGGEGFEGIEGGETHYMGYWHITGNKEGGEEKQLFQSTRGLSLEQVIEEAKEGIENVLKSYEDPRRGYPNNPFSGKEPAHPDYEHLSRILEWGTGSEESDAA